NRRLAAAVGEVTVLGNLITASPEMMKVTRTIEKVAPADVSVMLLGASGTGKELLARGLHDSSPRRSGNFVAINCAAIPDALLESELFGHEKGAFTGAIKTSEGKIELADGGTLFLDEIGDIPLPLQVKLLRFLQERVIERIGGRKPIPVDTRIVCATHRDVQAMVADGSFREDLYYRLAEITVAIPSLAERPGDAVLLARHFLQRFAQMPGSSHRELSTEAAAAIAAWHWPGNVRELENRVKRAAIMAEGKMITPADLDLGNADAASALPINLRAVRDAAEHDAIAQALAVSDRNISAAARLLGVSRPTLYDLMRHHGFGT
ncbi:MAG: sigma 54-interacting transcriptional regulator, partial [Sphingopyxis sp.]|nr:sigma 54-interacting transcriptional regulator [Sphingopyxis sp.]